MTNKNRLIRLSDVKNALLGWDTDPTDEEIEYALDKLPTVDAVEVVHGRWIDNVDENGYLCNAWRKCSACGGLNYSKKPPYCPNCGAYMRGDEDD